MFEFCYHNFKPTSTRIADHAQLKISQLKDSDLKSLKQGKIHDLRVIGLDAGGGLHQTKSQKGRPNGEGRQGRIREKISRPSKPHTIEAHRCDALRYCLDGLFVEPLRHHSLHVSCPVPAGELHSPPRSIHNPS